MSAARSSAPAVGLQIALLVAFVLLTWPLATRPSDAVLSHWDADIVHSLWTQWWFATALESDAHALFRSDMIRYPHAVDLRLADLNLAVNALGYGLGKLFGPAAAYNAALLLAFLASGELMRRLCLRLGGSPPAAALAALAFAASPYWLACALNGWGYLVHVWVLPLVFLALLRLRDAPGAQSGALLGLALALTFHVTPYYFVYALVLLAVLGVACAAALRAWLRLPGVATGLAALAALLAVAVAPRALGMLDAASAELVVHHGPQNTALAAPLAELVWPSAGAVEARLPRLGYLVPFLGYTLLATLVAALALVPGRRALLPWLGAGAVMLVLALGPVLKLTDAGATGPTLPARWLQALPVFDLTTNHWRFVLPAGFSLAVAFALGLTALMQRFGARPLGLAVGVALVLEVAWVWPFPRQKPLFELRISPVAELLRDREDVAAVLDRTSRGKLNQTVHGKPIALGWLPRVDAATQRADEQMLAACRDRPPECLRRYGIGAVLRDDDTALLLLESGNEVLRAR